MSVQNFIGFEIKTTQEFLANQLEEILDSAVSSEPMEVNSVEIVLERVGEAEIRPDGKMINIYLPLKIDLKRAAGLFTVEGNGAINLHLAILYDISSNLRLTTRTELVTHEWIEKPRLEIGALNIPIETLVNMVLKHHESLITAKIDSSLKFHANLAELLNKGIIATREKLSELDLKGNEINFEFTELGLSVPETSDGMINIDGYLKPIIAINKKIERQKEKVNFEWINQLSHPDRELDVPVMLSYEVIGSQIKDQLQGLEVGGKQFEIVSINITGGEELNIQMQIDEPIKAQVFIKGSPIYNEIEEVLLMEDIDVKVNPANFIYKLTAPLVNRFIENKMEDFFPLDISSKIREAIEQNLPKNVDLDTAQISINQNGVSIQELSFEQKGIEGVASIKNLNIGLEIK